MMELNILQMVYFIVLAFILMLILTVLFIYVTSKPPNMYQYESEKLYIDPNKDKKRIAFERLEDEHSVDLSVIVPAYNEEDRLPVMLNEAMDYFIKRKKDQPKFTYEIIVVDDGSRDKTTEIALLYSQKYGVDQVRVLTLVKNCGKGGAVRKGMMRARGKWLLFADADGATKFSDVAKLEREMSELDTAGGMAIVCGSRAHLEKQSISTRSVLRTILMFGFHFLVWFLCVRGVKDTQCGFKMFTRPAARLLFSVMHVERWAFDVDLLHIAQHYCIPVREVAVNWKEIEGSKLSPMFASLQMLRDLILIRLRYMIGAWSMLPPTKIQ